MEIKKCANLQQIRSERDIHIHVPCTVQYSYTVLHNTHTSTYNVECSAVFTVHYNMMSYVYKFALRTMYIYAEILTTPNTDVGVEIT